jgi:AcrR family transcriptional regulator
VADKREDIVVAGRRLFGRYGYADTQIEHIAAEAGMTLDALHVHFKTKRLVFEAVFEALHMELVLACSEAASASATPLEMFRAAFGAYFDSMLDPAVQRIAMVDGAAVLGTARFNELDERFVLGALSATMRQTNADGLTDVRDPDNVARLILGAVARGAMQIATSKDPALARQQMGAALEALAIGVVPKD